jgi:hypothetical protein
MDTATVKNESTPGREFAELTAQARAAYQEKRTKECIDITHRVLLADPGNAEANALCEAVQADIQRDLNDARALLEDSRSMTDGQKYRKAAEIILLKILYLDAAHVEAKELLTVAKGSVAATTTPVRSVNRTAHFEETAFTASPEPVAREPEPRGPGLSLKVPLICVAIVALSAGLWFFKSRMPATVAEADAPLSRTVQNRTPVTTSPSNAGRSVSVNAPPAPAVGVTAPIPEPPAKAVNSSYVPPVPVPVKGPAPVVTAASAPAVPPQASRPAVSRNPGSLAVNSAIAADIYMGDKYLGATPTTLPLPPGRQTVEYRHGDLRTVMTHDIRSGETTTAFVTFETIVQINARPWAQVFVEGTSRKALGQTPLSSVRVPIGSVLTFENPNFPPKSHRVQEADSAIQVVFQ